MYLILHELGLEPVVSFPLIDDLQNSMKDWDVYIKLLEGSYGLDSSTDFSYVPGVGSITRL